MSFAFCAAGIGEALITSTHTSFEAARAAARLPAAALLQIPSTLLLVLAGSVGSRSIISLQIATYSFTPEASVALRGAAGAVVVDLLVVAVGVLAGVLAGVAGVLAAVELVAGVLAVVAGVLAAVELSVVELPLLPQAARSAVHDNATTSSAIRLPTIDPPWIVRALAHGCRANRQTRENPRLAALTDTA